MAFLSVLCNSVVGKNNTQISKGEHIPLTVNSDGTCILNFEDERQPVTLPESELDSCGFIFNDTV